MKTAPQFYIYSAGEQSGPFAPEQIRSLWTSGKLQADSLYFDDTLKRWNPVAGLIKTMQGQKNRKTAGYVVAIIIAVLVVVAWLAVSSDEAQTDQRNDQLDKLDARAHRTVTYP